MGRAGGVSRIVLVSTAFLISGGVPGVSGSCRVAIDPGLQVTRCQRHTVGIPVRRDLHGVRIPPPLTPIRERQPTFRGVFRSAISRSNRTRSSGHAILLVFS